MTQVLWLTQCEADVPAVNSWLSPQEVHHYDTLRLDKRRHEWLLGRWTAKRAIASFLNLDSRLQSFANICIAPGPDGAPVVHLFESHAPISISISHRGEFAFCAVAAGGHVVGCDLELVENRSDAFVSDYFTSEEHQLLYGANRPDRSRMATLMWSAKESVLKVVHAGMRLDTRSVSVRLLPQEDAGWHPFRAEFLSGATFRGWWRIDHDLVLTVAAFPPATDPVQLWPRPVDNQPAQILPFGQVRGLEVCQA